MPETINTGLDAEETLWHVRAALNVAALLCGSRPRGAALVQRYNALLTKQKAPLKLAYAAETHRFGSGDPAALDKHMTQLYNFFAKPDSTSSFCEVAEDVAEKASTTSASELVTFATPALGRLQSAILTAAPATPTAIANNDQNPEAPQLPGEWRIQLGAFTGQAAASAAWAKVRAQLPTLSSYRPHFEPVPSRNLVRLQIGSASDRASALRLCAAAATGGFDCIAVRKGR